MIPIAAYQRCFAFFPSAPTSRYILMRFFGDIYGHSAQT